MYKPPSLPTESSTLLAELIEAVAAHLQMLPDKPEETAEATVHALWHKASGTSLSLEAACQTTLPNLDKQGQARLKALISQRLAGTPLAYLTGRQQFMNIELLADRRALIPRKETELLGYTALNILDDIRLNDATGLRAIDLCTGSGNLACAMAKHLPELHITGSDISIEALTCAMGNRSFLNLDPQRIGFIASDLLYGFNPSACRQKISMIICNPPYISEAKVSQLDKEIICHEPSQAFNGGPLGLSILTRLVKESAAYLTDHGWICCEVGLGQGKWLAQRFERTRSYQRVITTSDTSGEIRVVAAQRNSH